MARWAAGIAAYGTYNNCVMPNALWAIERNRISSSMTYIVNKHSEDRHFHTRSPNKLQARSFTFPQLQFTLTLLYHFPLHNTISLFRAYCANVHRFLFLFFFEPSIVGTNFHTTAKLTVVQESQPLEACPSIYPWPRFFRVQNFLNSKHKFVWHNTTI